jgi:bcr-type benzoyl-CoA reductase subunit B
MPAKLQAQDELKSLMAAYYLEAKNASYNGKKVAWVSSGAPVEFLYALDYIPIYPENYAAMCGASKQSPALIAEAEAAGYSSDLCSYARCDIGADIVQGGPVMGLPDPDLIVAGTNICTTIVKWFQQVAYRKKKPFVAIEMPYLTTGLGDGEAGFVVAQFKRFRDAAAGIAGVPFDEDKFIEVVRLSAEGSRLWGEVLDVARRSPAPLSALDAFIHIAPIVTLRGTEKPIEYYKALLKELDSLSHGGLVTDVQHTRLLWDNLPIWFRLRRMSEFLASRGAIVVASTYTNSWAAIKDMPRKVEDIYGALARAYLEPYINRNFPDRVKILSRMASDFSAHGMIMHSNRSCKPYSIGQYMLKDMFTKETGKPVLILDADMNDPRAYSDEQAEGRIEAFLESIAN